MSQHLPFLADSFDHSIRQGVRPPGLAVTPHEDLVGRFEEEDFQLRPVFPDLGEDLRVSSEELSFPQVHDQRDFGVFAQGG